MLFTLLKVAYRNFFRQKSYSIINLSGLAVGIASSILIALFVLHEFSYDSFHENADLIYRTKVKGQMMGSEMDMVVTSPPMGPAMLEDYPEVKNFVRLRQYGDWLVRYEDKKFHEEDFLFADSTFFEVFDFKLIRGNPHTVLDEPRSVVLTESTARKYFGKEDPIGKMLHLETDTTYFKVTGIVEDVPANSHFTFDLLGSLHTYTRNTFQDNFWVSHNYWTYILVNSNANIDELKGKLNLMVDKYVGPQIEEVLGIDMEEFEKSGNTFGYQLQALKDIHLNSDLQYEIEANGNKTLVYIFIIIGILILIVAMINFMNLSTARSTGRAREVGIKKVVGSSRKKLIFQFFLESVFITYIALLFAILIVELVLPAFNNITQLELDINYLDNIWILPSLLVFGLVVGVLAGSYPAFVLASFKPTSVLKGSMVAGVKGSFLRRVLVVAQFTVAITILLGSFVAQRQIGFILNKDLGFDKENVLVIRRSDALDDQIEAFKQELSNLPEVISVTHSNNIPGRNFSNNATFVEGRPTTDIYLSWQGRVSYEFAETFSLEMAEGRFFDKNVRSDSAAVVLNQAAVKALGLEENTLEKRLMMLRGPNEYMFVNIIGVLKDFNFQSLHEDIEAMVLFPLRGNPEGYIPVKLKGNENPKTIEEIKKIWEKFNQDYPFDYFWMDDDFESQYETEKRTGNILLLFSILSIFISCLGLFGLISFTSEKRTKEIGIRKSMGASIPGILTMLSKETLVLIGISAIFSTPVYLVINKWLQNFAFHFKFNPGVFALWLGITLIVILVIALITVNAVAIGAARKNPANSLRHE